MCKRFVSFFVDILFNLFQSLALDFRTNFGLKEACEIINAQQQSNPGKEAEIGTTCPHVKMVPQKDLQHCDHCKLEFCQHCILNHKMIIKMETELISYDVRIYLKFGAILFLDVFFFSLKEELVDYQTKK